MKALIFDVDGTLVDTERHGHLPACNDAFAALDLPIIWTWETFKAIQHTPGNARRLRWWLEQHTELPLREIDRLVDRFIPLKQSIYIEQYLPALRLRPGVERIIAEAIEAGLRLAVVSVSHEAQIHALLRTHLAPYYEHFRPVLGKESGAKTGDQGFLYERCLAEMGLSPHEAIAVEDSESGFRAAKRAGLPTAVIYNDHTFGHAFPCAELVARSLESLNLETLIRLCAAPIPMPSMS